MSPRTLANPADPAPAITPDLAAVLHDARPHPQLVDGAPPAAPAPSGARLAQAAAAMAADLAATPPDAGPGPTGPTGPTGPAGPHASYRLPAGTRARVHRAAPGGVLLLAPCDAPRAVAAVAPGIYVVVEASS